MKRLNKIISVSWVYASSAANIGAGFILLPFILHYLKPEDIGIWFVFVTIIAGAQLIEMGFQATLTRNIAYIYAGAKNLTSIGLPGNNIEGTVNYPLLTRTISSVKVIYLIFAAVGAIILISIGLYYVPTITDEVQNKEYYHSVWLLFTIAGVLNISNGWMIGLLYGKGEYEQFSKVNLLSKSLLLVTAIVGLNLGHGLMSLGVSAIIGASTAKLFLIRNLDGIASSAKISFVDLSEEISILRILSVNALKTTIVQVGGFLIQRANIIIMTIFMGAAKSASYSLSITILLALSGISMAICQVQLPKITRLQIRLHGNTLGVKYGETIVISFLMYISGSLIFLSFGNDILNMIGSSVELIGKPYFTIMIIICFLEMNHSLAGSYLTTLNNVPFLRASLISGLFIVIGSYILVPSLGVGGILLMQGGVQLLYNNWKWPFEVSRNLKYSHLALIKMGGLSIFKKLYLIK